MQEKYYDVVIIGAGPIGLACAIEAKRIGFTHLVLEKGTLVNSIYHFPANMTFFSSPELLEIGDVPFSSVRERPNRQEALEYYRRVTLHHHLNIQLFEEVRDIKRKDKNFLIETMSAHYRARFVIIATGFYDTPNRLNIPGEDLPKVKHYFEDPHPYFDKDVLIIGGGNSAVQAALECYRKGARVTIAVREEKFDSSIKYWILPNILNRIQEGSIRALFCTSVGEIQTRRALLQTPAGEEWLKNDFVLALIGYQPNYSFLEKIGIAIRSDSHRTPEHHPETHETNIPGLYLAGVVCGGMQTSKWFIETARFHPKKIFAHMQTKY